MNYLALCQRLVRESPITGNGPTTVVGQTGAMRQVTDWIDSAYVSIQSMHPRWLFMADEYDFVTEADKSTYTASEGDITDLETWNTTQCDMKIYNSVSDEGFLVYLPWDQFRLLIVGTGRTQEGRPTHYTVKPDNSIMFFPVPDDVYTITGQYYKQPVHMSANTDTPLFSAKYHEAIVWSALMMYCAYASIADLYAQAEDKYRRLIRKLEIEQLPKIRYGNPLA